MSKNQHGSDLAEQRLVEIATDGRWSLFVEAFASAFDQMLDGGERRLPVGVCAHRTDAEALVADWAAVASDARSAIATIEADLADGRAPK